MTDQPTASYDVTTPALLGATSSYYRRMATDADRRHTAALEQGAPAADVAAIAREHALWVQLADEIDAYLDVDDGPGLFDDPDAPEPSSSPSSRP